MDFEKDIVIDDSALDLEWLNQPILAVKYGKYWAECAMRVQQAEETVKLVRSELIEKANNNPEEFLGEGVKPTAPVVEAYYRNHKRHKQAKEELVRAQYELNISEIVKKEISVTRKAALENLVELYGRNYFAGPKLPRDLTMEAAKKHRADEVDKGVAGQMQRKKKTIIE